MEVQHVRDHLYKIEHPECEITIEERPPYCDRGRYIVKVFPRGKLALSFDHQDGFPRYYFSWKNMLEEIEAWMDARNLTQ